MNLKFHQVSNRSLAAFTLIEIALALGVIAFALVAIIGVLPAGMSVQKDNREVTIINFDAKFLMDAVRSGALGQDDLTNYVINITNYSTKYNSLGSPKELHVTAYTMTNYSIDGAVTTSSFLTNGRNIIGLLSIPKYYYPPNGGGIYYSNYTTADFRAITAALADQGTSQTARDFAFTYRLYPEVIPSASYAYAFSDNLWNNFSAPGLVVTNNFQNPADVALSKNLQANFNQIRLRFRWPILPNGQLGTSRQTFRSAASGAIFYDLPVSGALFGGAFIQSGTYQGQP